MDPSDHYPDPFGEALSYSSQRAAQMGHWSPPVSRSRRQAGAEPRQAGRTRRSGAAGAARQERAAHAAGQSGLGARPRSAVAGPGGPAPGRRHLGGRRPVRGR